MLSYAKQVQMNYREPNKSFIVIWSPLRQLEDYNINVTHQIIGKQIWENVKLIVLVFLFHPHSHILSSKIMDAASESSHASSIGFEAINSNYEEWSTRQQHCDASPKCCILVFVQHFYCTRNKITNFNQTSLCYHNTNSIFSYLWKQRELPDSPIGLICIVPTGKLCIMQYNCTGRCAS